MGEKETAEAPEDMSDDAGAGDATEATAAKAAGGKAQESQRINLNSSKSNTP